MVSNVYVLKSPITGEVVYVGESIRPARRLKDHMYGRTNKYVSEWVASIKPLKPILDVIYSGEDCDEVEHSFIKTLKPILNKIIDGKATISNPKQKQGIIELLRKAVDMYDVLGNKLLSFDSETEACEAIGYTRSGTFSRHLNGKGSAIIVNGFVFCYENESIKTQIKRYAEKQQKVMDALVRNQEVVFKRVTNGVFDEEGRYFFSQSECALFHNISRQRVSELIKKGTSRFKKVDMEKIKIYTDLS